MSQHNISPTRASLVKSLAFDLSGPLLLALLAIFGAEHTGWWGGSIAILFAIYSLPNIFRTLRVHAWKVNFDQNRISVETPNPIERFSCEWNDISKATLRQRKNLISGTDRVLILENKKGETIWLNISTFLPTQIETLMDTLRKHTIISSIHDDPTI